MSRASRGIPVLPWADLALVVCCVAVYWRTLGFGLYLDDLWLVRSWSGREVATTFTSQFDPSGLNPPYFRPLAAVTFALDSVIWGTSTWGPHVTNLALHIAAVVLVHRALRRIRLPGWVSFAGAAYFAFVPSNVATVVYVAHRTDAMVAICIVAGLLFVGRYEEARSRVWLAGLLAASVIAVLSKEVALAVVPMVGVWWWFLQVESEARAAAMATGDEPALRWRIEPRRWWRVLVDPKRRRDWLLVLGPIVGLSVVYLAYRSAVLPSGALGERFAESQHPLRAVAGGLSSVVEGVPWELRSWTVAPMALLFASVFALAPRSQGWRVVLLGVGWMLGGIAPLVYSGGVEPRLLYVAQIGMATALAGALSALDDAVRGARPSGVGVRLLGGGAVVGLVGVTVFTLVFSIRAQNQFAEGSDKQAAADAVVLELPNVADHVSPDRLDEVRERVRAGSTP